MNANAQPNDENPADGRSASNGELGDTRRWRIERKNGDILRDVRFRHFTGENGYFLNDRCAIGNMEIGHMLRVDGNAIFRCA